MRRVKRVLANNEYNQVLPNTEGTANPFDNRSHHVGVKPLLMPTVLLGDANSYGEFVLRAAPRHSLYIMVPKILSGHKHSQHYGAGGHDRRRRRSSYRHRSNNSQVDLSRSVSITYFYIGRSCFIGLGTIDLDRCEKYLSPWVAEESLKIVSRPGEDH